jgi:hypothetical protein
MGIRRFFADAATRKRRRNVTKSQARNWAQRSSIFFVGLLAAHVSFDPELGKSQTVVLMGLLSAQSSITSLTRTTPCGAWPEEPETTTVPCDPAARDGTGGKPIQEQRGFAVTSIPILDPPAVESCHPNT